MKQSEIQEVINAEPTTVFTTSGKYNRYFIVTGFTKETPWNNKYGNPTTFALAKSVYFDVKTNTTSISNIVEKKALRMVGGVFSESLESFTTHKIDMEQRHANAVIQRTQKIDTLNQIKPQLASAMKALNIENKARNYADETTFKIELDGDSAEALLALLNTIALEQVNA
jgi:hypothetical protein